MRVQRSGSPLQPSSCWLCGRPSVPFVCTNVSWSCQRCAFDFPRDQSHPSHFGVLKKSFTFRTGPSIRLQRERERERCHWCHFFFFFASNFYCNNFFLSFLFYFVTGYAHNVHRGALHCAVPPANSYCAETSHVKSCSRWVKPLIFFYCLPSKPTQTFGKHAIHPYRLYFCFSHTTVRSGPLDIYYFNFGVYDVHAYEISSRLLARIARAQNILLLLSFILIDTNRFWQPFTF